jgi:phosphoenolpyruvate carboxykinase (GTP)
VALARLRENSRVLKWICERVDGADTATKTAIGNLPKPDALDVQALDLDPGFLEQLLRVDLEGWRREAENIGQYYESLGQRLPPRLAEELEALRRRLGP